MEIQYPINERLIKFCEFRNIAQKDLKERLHIKSKSQISNWWNHQEEVSSGYVIKIIREFPDLNANWLIKNIGDMLLTGEIVNPTKTKQYKSESKLDVVNEGVPCCKLCEEKDKQIEELKQDKEWLKKQIEDKKETSLTNRAQYGESAKHGKTG